MNQFNTNEEDLRQNKQDYKKYKVQILDKYCFENIKRLKTRIEDLRKLQKKMNKVNRYYDKHKGDLQGCKYVTEQEITELYKKQSERIYKGKPYSIKEMYRNAKSIIIIENIIEKLEELEQQNYPNVQIPNNFMTIEENTKENRLKLYFISKPNDKVLGLLKQNTFRWYKKDNSWNRVLSYGAILATAKFIKQLKGVIL